MFFCFFSKHFSDLKVKTSQILLRYFKKEFCEMSVPCCLHPWSMEHNKLRLSFVYFPTFQPSTLPLFPPESFAEKWYINKICDF